MRLFSALAVLLLMPAAHAAEPMRDLHYFAGRWDCAGHFSASGKPIASRMRYAVDLQGAVLVKHHDDRPPANYHALEVWEYDAGAGRYRATVMDGHGSPRTFVSPGWSGNRLVWTTAQGTVPAQRFVYVREGTARYRVDWEIARAGGAFVLGDTLQCSRQR